MNLDGQHVSQNLAVGSAERPVLRSQPVAWPAAASGKFGDRSDGGLIPMRRRFVGWTIAAAAIFGLTPSATVAQGSAGTAQNLPRTSDGKPDLSGIWQVMNTAAWDIQDHSAQKGIPAGQGVVEGNEIPYQPWAAAKKKENFENRATADPEASCYLPGLPRATYMPFPLQIFQTSNQIAIVYEYVHALRRIHLNSKHPEEHIDWWMGDSRGRWEGDALVVDVIDFIDETWFDRAGNFHSDALHLIERYTPISANHINYEVTIEDPKVFTRPWKMSMLLYRRLEKNLEILEYDCYAFDFEFPWAAEIP